MSELIEATLRLTPHKCWVAKLLTKHKGVIIRILDCREDSKSKGVRQLFEIVSPPDKVDELVEDIRQDKTVQDLKLVVSKTGRVYGSVNVSVKLPCSLAESSGCFLRAVTSNVKGGVEWKVVGTHATYRRLIELLENIGVSLEVNEVQKLKNNHSLTGRQEVVLKTALDMGYFDYPKQVGIEELSKVLGITPATTTEILRKSIKKMLKHYYDQTSVSSVMFLPLKNNDKIVR